MDAGSEDAGVRSDANAENDADASSPSALCTSLQMWAKSCGSQDPCSASLAEECSVLDSTLSDAWRADWVSCYSTSCSDDAGAPRVSTVAWPTRPLPSCRQPPRNCTSRPPIARRATPQTLAAPRTSSTTSRSASGCSASATPTSLESNPTARRLHRRPMRPSPAMRRCARTPSRWMRLEGLRSPHRRRVVLRHRGVNAADCVGVGGRVYRMPMPLGGTRVRREFCRARHELGLAGCELSLGRREFGLAGRESSFARFDSGLA